MLRNKLPSVIQYLKLAEIKLRQLICFLWVDLIMFSELTVVKLYPRLNMFLRLLSSVSPFLFNNQNVATQSCCPVMASVLRTNTAWTGRRRKRDVRRARAAEQKCIRVRLTQIILLLSASHIDEDLDCDNTNQWLSAELRQDNSCLFGVTTQDHRV